MAEGGVTFNKFGRCVPASTLQNEERLRLTRIEDQLQTSTDVAASIGALAANQDLLAICPAGSLDAPGRKRRQLIRTQIGPEGLVNFVSGPDVATVEFIEAATPPPDTTTTMTEEPSPISDERAGVPVPARREAKDKHFQHEVREAKSLLDDLVSELDELHTGTK